MFVVSWRYKIFGCDRHYITDIQVFFRVQDILFLKLSIIHFPRCFEEIGRSYYFSPGLNNRVLRHEPKLFNSQKFSGQKSFRLFVFHLKTKWTETLGPEIRVDKILCIKSQ